MKSELIPFLAACLIAIFVGIGFGLITSPSSPWLPYEAALNYPRNINQPTNEQQQDSASNKSAPSPQEFLGLLRAEQKDCYQGEKEGECAARITQDRVAGFYVYLIIAAVVQALVGVLTVKISRRQANIMAQQAEIAHRQISISQNLERPLMLPLPPRFGKLGYAEADDKSLFPEIEINFRNYGRSPAIIDCAVTAVIVGRTPPVRTKGSRFFYATSSGEWGRTHVNYPIHRWPSRWIVPDDSVGWFDRNVEDRLTAVQIEDIETRRQKVWLDGIIFYEDVFGVSHETHFRWVYEPSLDIMILDEDAEANRYT